MLISMPVEVAFAGGALRTPSGATRPRTVAATTLRFMDALQRAARACVALNRDNAASLLRSSSSGAQQGCHGRAHGISIQGYAERQGCTHADRNRLESPREHLG